MEEVRGKSYWMTFSAKEMKTISSSVPICLTAATLVTTQRMQESDVKVSSKALVPASTTADSSALYTKIIKRVTY